MTTATRTEQEILANKTKPKPETLEQYYGTYPKQDKGLLVRIGDVSGETDQFDLLVRAYSMNLDENATEYDLSVRDWYKVGYLHFPYAFGEDIAGQIRQDLINRARKVGLPDEATEVEVIVAERKKARNFFKVRESKRVELARSLGLKEAATDHEVEVARIANSNKGYFRLTDEQIKSEVTRIEAEDEKTAKELEASLAEEAALRHSVTVKTGNLPGLTERRVINK